jgi:hypothetical protein
VSTSRLEVGMEFIVLRGVRRVESPKASKPDFTGVTVY